MNGHSYGISKLTTAHSRELLSEGHRRQLAKTVPPRPRLALREHGRLVHTWASRSWVWPFYSRAAYARSNRTAATPLDTGKSTVTGGPM